MTKYKDPFYINKHQLSICWLLYNLLNKAKLCNVDIYIYIIHIAVHRNCFLKVDMLLRSKPNLLRFVFLISESPLTLCPTPVRCCIASILDEGCFHIIQKIIRFVCNNILVCQTDWKLISTPEGCQDSEQNSTISIIN